MRLAFSLREKEGPMAKPWEVEGSLRTRRLSNVGVASAGSCWKLRVSAAVTVLTVPALRPGSFQIRPGAIRLS
jgi:hypothetical protein